MTKSKEFLFDADQDWEIVTDGVDRKIMGFDEKIMLVKVRFQKGAIGSLHHHHHSQVTYIESGTFEMTIGDEVKTISTGDSFYIPTNMTHGIVCLEAGMLIDVFSPLREDFMG